MRHRSAQPVVIATLVIVLSLLLVSGGMAVSSERDWKLAESVQISVDPSMDSSYHVSHQSGLR